MVTRLVDALRPAGPHQATWDGQTQGSTVASGVYFMRLEALGRSFGSKIVIIR
jgi:hypothetical protein